MKRAVFAAVLAFFALLAEAQESQTAFNFLRLPVSAHAAALGGDNISIVGNDLSMLFHNPALINNVADRTIDLNMMTYMEGAFTASASFARIAGERSTWAASAQLMSYGSMREMTAEGTQTGEFSAKDIALSGAYAYALTDKITGGVNAKFVASYIGQYNSLAAAVDLGLNYFDDATEWSVSAVARNLGGQLSAYEDDFERMPLDVQLGVTKRLIGSPLRLSATLVRLNDWLYGIGKHLVVGADLLLTPQFYLSAGYNTMRASEMKIAETDGSSAHGAGLSLGGGLLLERFQLNVAYARYHVSSSSLVINLSLSL